MEKNYSSIRLFSNPWLERLTHVHPVVPLVLWVPIICLFLWRSVVFHELSFFSILGTGLLGLVSWTLVEYVLHRFVFHFEGESRFAQYFHFMVHGAHHADPRDPTRLVMPPAASIVLAFLFYQLFAVILGPVYVDPFFAFFLVGYLCYDYIHFSVHHFRPKTGMGRWLKQVHMDHHYLNPNSRWGVSSPLWDYVFGTIEESQKKTQTVSHS